MLSFVVWLGPRDASIRVEGFIVILPAVFESASWQHSLGVRQAHTKFNLRKVRDLSLRHYNTLFGY